MAQFDLSITIEYDIITAPDFGELVTKVNELIQSGEGWQPLGGVAISGDNEDWEGMGFYQAIVREKHEVTTALTFADEVVRVVAMVMAENGTI